MVSAAGGWGLVAGLGAGLLVVGAAVAAVVEVVGRRRHRRACRGACWVTVLPAPAVDPHGAAQFWRSALGLLLPDRWTARLAGVPHLVFEYRFRPAGIEIGIWVPGSVAAELVASAVRAAWPGTRTTITPAEHDPDLAYLATPAARSVDGSGLVVEGGVLRLARDHGLPIQDAHAEDPARGVLAAPGLLGAGQWARVQVLARPVSGARFARTARSRGPGRGASGVLASASTGLATAAASVATSLVSEGTRALLDVTSTGHRSRRPTPGRSAPPSAGARAVAGPQRMMDSAADRAVAGKLGGAGGGFVTVIRYAAATPTRPATTAETPVGSEAGADAEGEAWARARARSRGIAHGLASGFAVFSGHNHFRRRPLRRPLAALAGRRLRRGDLLSVPELAAVAHLPTSEHVPGLRRAGAAAVAPPPQVPAFGPGIKPLGVSDAVAGRPIGVSVPDARHHTWVVGATGAGKSTLLVHGVLADADAGRSAVVLDPKGDLIGDILTRLPSQARGRTMVIDPATPQRRRDGSLAWPVLNPLSPHPGPPGTPRPGYASAVGDPAMENVVTIFSRVFAAAWGFRSDDLLRVACLTVRAGRQTPTLAALPALLSDADTRARAVALLARGSRLREFWAWFERLSEPARAQISAPLLNKLRAVLLRPFAEQVLCAGPSTVDLTGLLDGGGLLLVRLPKGVLGEETTRLLGSLIVAQVWQAAIARAAVAEHARRDASLVLDECQNFLHLPYRIEDMLAEARGFRLALTLAHQHLAQLTPELRDGIATNARNKIAFLSSPEDAARLAKHTLPELGAHDLAHLDAFHAAARLMCAGSESRAFTLTTRPLPDPAPHRPRPTPPRRPPGRTSPRSGSLEPLARPAPTGPPRSRRPQTRPPGAPAPHIPPQGRTSP